MPADVYVDRRTPGIAETVVQAPAPATTWAAPAYGGGWSGPLVHRRISWAAILAGVVMIVVVQLLLSVLGAGIGLGTVDVAAGSTPTAGSLATGAGLWWIVSSAVALLFGGFTAAWLAGVEIRFDGLLHGLIAWGLASLLTAYLLTSAIGSVAGAGAAALGGIASAAGSGIKAAAQPAAQVAGVSPQDIQNQAQAYLQPANPDPATMSPQDAQKQIAASLLTYAQGGADAAPARDRVIAIMAAQQKISPSDAAKQFDDIQARLKQQKDQAVQAARTAADASAKAASAAAYAVFGQLALGAVCAMIGGALGISRRSRVTAAVR